MSPTAHVARSAVCTRSASISIKEAWVLVDGTIEHGTAELSECEREGLAGARAALVKDSEYLKQTVGATGA
ncbi:hypothetical protein CKO29_01440 [Allochromatium vinosum]|nr:hypothetical protein [Allochromatium vinosum]